MHKAAKRLKDKNRSRSSCMFVWLDIVRCLHVKLQNGQNTKTQAVICLFG